MWSSMQEDAFDAYLNSRMIFGWMFQFRVRYLYKTNCAAATSPHPQCHRITMALIYSLFYDWFMLILVEIGHALRKQTAGLGGPDLAKKLSQLVKMEKNVMRSMELVGRERMEVAVSKHVWVHELQLTFSSNNSPSGVRHATMTFRM
jgi:hypothetical protein